MNVRKKLKRLIAMMVCAVMVLGCTMVAQAADLGSASYNDLNPYKGNLRGQCTWYVWGRTHEKLGISLNSKNRWGNASSWYDRASADGYAVGTTPQANSIMVWTGGAYGYGHVAFVEAVNGDRISISEGNYDGAYHEETNTIAGFNRRYSMDSEGNKYPQAVKGFIYLQNTPVPVSLTWSGDRCEPDSSNVFVYTEAHTNISGSFTEAGITIWDESGNVVASKSENPARTGMQLNIYYNVTDELGVVLKSGTNYTYQFYTVFNGTKYTTDVQSFRTKGMAENSWTQELNIADWTYGETPNTPAAAAKYGTPSFTYSNEKDGTYTAEVPQAAGTYYVKATVAAVNDQYTGLEAVKEFRINKANPEYSVPQNLTMIYSNRLESVTLPEGFSWYDSTELSGPVGERLAYAFYTPADTDNYNVVEMIEIPITVQAKDLSGMKLEGIDKNTDLDKYEIKDGDTVLVKGQDYVISSETKGDTVTVTVEFKGNYTGKTQTSFSLKTTDNNTDKDKDTGEKESDVPKTGDNSTFTMWAAMLALAGGAVVVTVRERKFSR